MPVLIFSSLAHEAEPMFQQAVSALVPEDRLETYRSLAALARRLRQPACDRTIAVIRVSDQGELSELSDLSHLLAHVQLILVLPDESKETMEKAYRLHPRYVSYFDRDFLDVAAVLSKMLSRNNSGGHQI
ncbi:MAG: hypothetical protein V1742_03320 [Pseudomonadota bacterium]